MLLTSAMADECILARFLPRLKVEGDFETNWFEETITVASSLSFTCSVMVFSLSMLSLVRDSVLRELGELLLDFEDFSMIADGDSTSVLL